MTTTRRSIIEWEEIFREQEASGESVATFCIRRGISMSPFYRYRRRLRATAASRALDPSQPAFVPVAITPLDPKPCGPHCVGDTVTLMVGKATMTLSSAVPPAWMAALLMALEA
ncbi:MAG: IS66 family insertion sequence element accessory protein TnpA [Acidiferrobacteraceae bacterium]